MHSPLIYLQFARFLFPLVFTLVVQGLSSQFLNGGMARMPHATQTLASYGLAWGLADFLASPLSQVRQLGLVLGESHQARRRLLRFVLACGGALGGVLALLAWGPAGEWVIEDLHQVEPSLSKAVRQALVGLAFIPVLEGVAYLYSGLLLRLRRTEVVSAATIARIGVSITAVFALLPVPLIQQNPIWLPVLVTYAGMLADLGIVLWGYRRYVAPVLPAESGQELSLSYVFRFFWPLALIMAIQGGSRPLINLFVARGQDGPEALAVLAIVYPLANLPYG